MNHMIDLNCDLGETHPSLSNNWDAEIMPYITSCNIACGYHAGSEAQISQTVDLAMKHNVAIGAHPSYDDWEYFGRRSLDVPVNVLKEQIASQVSTVKRIVEAKGGHLHHVKPHGALYHDMANQLDFTTQILERIKKIDSNLIIYGLSGSQMVTAAANVNLTFYSEAFSDRAYDTPTRLKPRSLENSVLTDTNDVINQVKLLLLQQIVTDDGQLSPITVDTICLHSDTLGAAQLAQHIHQFISASDVNFYQAM